MVVVGAAIWAKVAQLAPWHRSTMYPVTATLSVETVQLRLIWLPLAVAVRFVGAVGGCVSAIVPLLTFEPPAAVVRRLLAAIASLVREASSRTLYVCCTHSGPMRALAAWALGRDLGEPQNTEVVRARVRRDLSLGWITYRGATQAFAPTSTLDAEAGWGAAEPEGRRQP